MILDVTPTDKPVPAVRPKAVLVVLSAAAFMASLDLFIVNVALSDIGRDLGRGSLSDLSWVLNGYAIIYAALLVPAGRLADRFGRKSGFLLGLAVFVLASLGCALSGDLEVLVAFRLLQAAGAALLTPTSLGLLLAATPADRRASAVRAWAASGSLAAALGPVVGGLLVEASWRWIFLVNLPFGLAAVVAAYLLVPDSDHDRGLLLPDLLGGLVLIVSVGALATGLVKAPDWGWGSASTLGALVLSAVALTAFLLRSARHPVPVVELRLLKHSSFAWSNVTALLFSAAFAANLLSFVLWMEGVWHWSALRTGLGVAPGPLMVPVFAAIGHRLTQRFKVGHVTAAGSLLLGVGVVMILSSIGPTPSYAGDFLPGWLVGGIGVGLALPTVLSSATTGLAPHQASTGSAIVNMSRQIGAVLGISVLVAVLAVGDPVAAFRHAWWVITGLAVAGAIAALHTTPISQPSPARGKDLS
ncbi:MAG TPA: MFS transporter [Mycobacteriales bacterium]|nr:MFS transporter [Mycobacteriales bacterium]